jgi:hypothetical protein
LAHESGGLAHQSAFEPAHQSALELAQRPADRLAQRPADRLAQRPAHELAQVNIAFAREPLERPLLADFIAALEPVNARADRAAGFVWRMQTGDGNSTAVRGFGGDPRLIINLTVWESIEALRAFVYDDPVHLAVMRRRREWFARLDLHTALWWVPTGHRPSVAEAEDRLAQLGAEGPTPTVFTFNKQFESPSAAAGEIDPGGLCRT